MFFLQCGIPHPILKFKFMSRFILIKTFLMHQHLHVLSYNYTLCLQSQFDILTCVNFIREHADPVKSL